MSRRPFSIIFRIALVLLFLILLFWWKEYYSSFSSLLPNKTDNTADNVPGVNADAIKTAGPHPQDQQIITIYATTSVPYTVTVTATVVHEPTPNAAHVPELVEVDPNRDIRKITDFTKYAAVEEQYSLPEVETRIAAEGLTEFFANASFGETERERRIRRFYHLAGDEDWRKYIDSLSDELLPPLTKFTQDYIYRHQHPTSCADKQFVLMRQWNDGNGLGTIVHGAGHILSLAIRNNRILIWDTDKDGAPGRNFFEPNCLSPGSGEESGTRSMDCLFLPLTSCKLSDLKPENTVLVKAYWGPPSKLLPGGPGTVPPLLGHALKRLHPDITADALKYWWRTQSAAYLLRLNSRGMDLVRTLRTNSTTQHGIHIDTPHRTSHSVTVPFPLPPGTFSMHVRHGDKGVEMELVPLSTYILSAESSADQNPLTLSRRAFISTEDPAVFEVARRTFARKRSNETGAVGEKEWTFFYSDIPRWNEGPEDQLKKVSNRTELTAHWIQQLLMAAECDAIVGTRGSGWNRLVDEVRCVWGTSGGGCRAPFLEVGWGGDWVYYNY